VAGEGSQVPARSAQRLGWKINKRSRALQGREESLSPLQGSIVLVRNQGRRCACPWLPYSAPSALQLGVTDEE